MPTLPYIPENITVHLGAPDSNAQNVTVTFPEYIANVASGEIYPTWPIEALKANIYAQISFALNKIYLEFYRSRGYNFDITNSTAFDQSFSPGRNVFENISSLVYEIFDTYIRRENFIEPLAARFCNGTTSTCEGLSQWGTVDLANQGEIAVDILKNYYGDDIVLNTDTPVMTIIESYPGTSLRLGTNNRYVYIAQVMLNLISTHYPIIPKINPLGYTYDEKTENAVRVFQETFNLTPDGITGRNTWYRMVYLYVGIRDLTELHSEGVTLNQTQATSVASINEHTKSVELMQFYLKVISKFYPTVPNVAITGVYDEQTKVAVLAFQREFLQDETGVVTEQTYDDIYRVYITLVPYLDEFNLRIESFSDTTLSQGMANEETRNLQRQLNYVMGADIFETGMYGTRTRKTVSDFQKSVNIPSDGRADKETKSRLGEEYLIKITQINSKMTQYPGYDLSKGMEDNTLKSSRQTITTPVRHLQQSLRDIGYRVIPDGVYGENTQNAVKAVQKKANINQSGSADYSTYNEIRRLWRDGNKNEI